MRIGGDHLVVPTWRCRRCRQSRPLAVSACAGEAACRRPTCRGSSVSGKPRKSKRDASWQASCCAGGTQRGWHTAGPGPHWQLQRTTSEHRWYFLRPHQRWLREGTRPTGVACRRRTYRRNSVSGKPLEGRSRWKGEHRCVDSTRRCRQGVPPDNGHQWIPGSTGSNSLLEPVDRGIH